MFPSRSSPYRLNVYVFAEEVVDIVMLQLAVIKLFVPGTSTEFRLISEEIASPVVNPDPFTVTDEAVLFDVVIVGIRI